MKTLFLILATFTLLSCNKEKSTTMAETTQQSVPLKAVANYTVEGLVITLDASKSTGNIDSYGYQLDVSTPTQSAVKYDPNSSQKATKDDKGNYLPLVFSPLTATVTKTGTYTFDLMVYAADGSMNQAQFNVIVK